MLSLFADPRQSAAASVLDLGLRRRDLHPRCVDFVQETRSNSPRVKTAVMKTKVRGFKIVTGVDSPIFSVFQYR
ncbi:hypothetical protein ElyMa_006632900, partial [Elysia marginata]